jgi:predicted nucleotidyltransferase
MARTRSLEKILEMLRQQIPMLTEHYSVETLEVFGSYVRSEQQRDSDLDILVTFKEAPSLLTFIAMENYLSDLLGVKVDLVMKDSLKQKIGERILQEAIPVEDAIVLKPMTEQFLRNLQGSLKGGGGLKTLVEERHMDNEKEK